MTDRKYLSTQQKPSRNINTATESPDAPHLHRSNDNVDDMDEDKEWEIVGSDDGSSMPKNETNMHFDITLGWGRWKHTLCSVDYSKTNQPVDDNDDHEDDEDEDEDVDEKGKEEGDGDDFQRKPGQHKGKTG